MFDDTRRDCRSGGEKARRRQRLLLDREEIVRRAMEEAALIGRGNLVAFAYWLSGHI
jgi:hypothetical protein